MTDLVQPTVELIAWTAFAVPPSVCEDYAIDGSEDGITGDGQDLAEFAGRACYQSWDRPNPKTATVDGYLGHILEVRHLSVLEHAYASFYFTGVSRSLTHELVRHRHFSAAGRRCVRSRGRRRTRRLGRRAAAPSWRRSAARRASR